MASLLSNEDISDIAARASTLDERRACSALRIGCGALANERLKSWCKSAAGADMHLFEKRLFAEGLNLDAAGSLVNDPAPFDHSMGQWEDTFRWSFEHMTMAPEGPELFIRGDWPLPFEELLVELIREARTRRNLQLDPNSNLLSAHAHAGLERHLLVTLSELLAPALYSDFCLFRLLSQPFGLCLAVTDRYSDSSERYRAYLDQLRKEGLRQFFLDRPVVARLIGTVVHQWIEVTAQALTRLTNDFEEICRTFPQDNTPRLCTEVHCGVSDPHDGGRTVFFFRFDNGFRIVYKPRESGIDAAWAGFLQKLEELGAPPSARAPRVLVRDGYGWCEWIEPAPCENIRAAAAFFERSGAALCLLYALQGTDIHFENVIACGSDPVIVDLETLLHPRMSTRFSSAGASDASRIAADRLSNSVLNTLYLPNWEVAARGRVAGIGALNAVERYQVPRWRYQNVNTDSMTLAQRLEVSAVAPYVPKLDGSPLASSSYATEICAGFELMYRFLMKQRAAIAAEDGPLSLFRGRRIRVLLRPTQLYYLILKRSLEFRYMSGGAEWSLHFDFLARLHGWDEINAEWIPILAVERSAMAELDIPAFHTWTDSRDLYAGSKRIAENFFDLASFDQVEDRLLRLSEADQLTQVEFIRQALESDRRWIHEPAVREGCGEADSSDFFSNEFAETWALKLADLLGAEAVFSGKDASWIGAVPVGGEEKVQLEVVGHDLYSGNGGIGLFFAALARLTGMPKYRQLALAALHSTRECVAGSYTGKRLARTIGLGGGTGIGSIIYSFSRSAVLLDDGSLIEDAMHASELISDERVAADRHFDALSGAAGAILGLLTLYRIRSEKCILDRAILCGRHLLNGRTECRGGVKLWLTMGEVPLTGMSHGVSGIAHALSRLHAVTGMPEFREAARDAIAYERSVFSPPKENWPDFRRYSGTNHQPAFLCRWCHGAPGIALVRLGLIESLDDDQVRAELTTAIKRTLREPSGHLDNLCCGNFGRLDVLFCAGHKQQSASLIESARCRGAAIARQAEQRGCWGWQSGNDRQNPGFFTGLAGVGYTLLRFAHPELLPCVMAWD